MWNELLQFHLHATNKSFFIVWISLILFSSSDFPKDVQRRISHEGKTRKNLFKILHLKIFNRK